MTFHYALAEEDIRTFFFYKVTTDKVTRRKRRTVKFIYPAIFLLLGSWFTFRSDSGDAGILMMILAIVWCAIFVLFEKQRYTRKFNQSVKAGLSEVIDRPTKLEVREGHWLLSGGAKSSEIPNADIKVIMELSTIWIVNSGKNDLILPKQGVDDAAGLKQELQQLAQKLNIQYTEHLEWKW